MRQMLVEKLGNWLKERNGTPTGGSACRWEENDGPTVDQFPRVGAVHLQQIMTGGPHWGHEWNQVKTKKWSEAKTESGKRAKVREGGSASRTSEDQSSTDPGGGSLPIKERVPPWQTPGDDGGSSQWKVDGQEFPALGGRRETARKVIGSADPSDTDMGRRPSGHPIPVSRVLDREMRPAKDIRSVPRGNHDVRTQGVQEPLASPLSPLAESFTPRPTSEEQQNQ